MRLFVRIYICILLTLVGTLPSFAQHKKDFIVVLDAGHGGKDAGCVGKTLKEKDLNLNIALKVGKRIEKNCPGVKVVYTRDTDVFVTLMDRTEKANKVGADLFISIHADAIPRTRKDVNEVYGAGTFTLGTAKSQANLDVAMRENRAILLEDNYEARYEGFDPSKPESYIIFDMMQSTYQTQSIEAADFIQKSLVNRGKRHNREVRQAGFYVLRTAAMPAVLIETGFISCNKEERYLASASGQENIADAIYRGFVDYKRKWDSRNNAEIAVTKPKKEIPQTTAKLKEKKGTTTAQPSTNTARQGVCWKIQFLSSTRLLKKGDAALKGLWPVEYYKEGDFYRYTYSRASDKGDLQEEIIRVKEKFKDAFVVKFDAKGKRIK